MEHLYHKKVETISLNKCAERNFYCPKAIDDAKNVYKNGSRYLSLNGSWEFKYYEANEIYHKDDLFNLVEVPSCWQSFGYGKVCYVNDRYLIEINPPYVASSAYGVYRRKIMLNKRQDEKYYLNFEGKDSCLYVYLNGAFVGFDSVSHATSEFDVTSYLIDGDNELVVFVYEVCVGTYFECQDKFRLSGLFRDVYLLNRPQNHLSSYQISYEKNEDKVQTTIKFNDNYAKKIKLYDENDLILEAVGNEIITFEVTNPKLWNAEEPNLYLLEISCNDEYIYDYIGYRFVELRNNVLYLNDTKIKILGVNHHDSNYQTGYYLSLDDYRKDVEIIKNHHMNAVRTSHYPPAPEFLYLCDEYGLYVMDEADIECHGAVWQKGEYSIDTFDLITENEVFHDVIFDRIMRLMIRDFNRPSILFWSAGNEAGYGQEIIKALQMMEKYDSSRLIHYENLYTADPEKNNYRLAFISQMYSSIEKMQDTLKEDSRGLILCEFSHAMGNSCGDIHDYVEFFDCEERVMGGFIWEYNDHLFPIGLDLNKPGYGGDFNEPVHNGNFCVDGVINYKREPHTSLLEIKAAFSRIKIKREGNRYYLHNLFDFTSINDNCWVKLTVTDFKGKNETKHFENIVLKPKNKQYLYTNKAKNVVLNFAIYYNDELYSQVSFVDDFEYEVFSDTGISQVNFKHDDLTLSNENVIIALNHESGLIKEVVKDGQVLLSDCQLNLLRAPIDNDMYEVDSWAKDNLFDYRCKLLSYAMVDKALEVKVQVDAILAGVIHYQINQDDTLTITSNFDINPNISYLPRLGYQFALDSSFDRYRYLGFGPYESYVDKHYLDTFDFYQAKIEAMDEYVKPQESYSHYLVKELTISNDDTSVVVSGMNSFTYLPHSLAEIKAKKHHFELVSDGYNYLSLDYMMSGIGSHSCGPELYDRYKLKEKKIHFVLRIGEGK